MSWSQGLTEGTAAFQIAASGNSHVRVLAGPGAGKSFAMKRRVARLLENGVDPRRILPVTFTRVAADDLHRELVNMEVEGCDRLRGTTLHSLALRTLMRHHVLNVTGRTPRPLNGFELKPLEADLSAHGGLREIRMKLRAYESAWARLQNDIPGAAQSPEEISFANDLVQWLIFHQAMLIGEVIPKLHEYLRLNPAAPERTEYAHILVDEYQDLNKAEQAVISLLSDDADVCIVGDDDQSIYSFKHAHPEGIREWIEVNPAADDLTLVECRRCPTRVVTMANSLIAHNQSRPLPRQLVPRDQNGEGVVRIVQYATLADEVAGVSATIADLIQAGTHPEDILLLAQRGVIGTPIFEQLKSESIPVRSYYAEVELDADDAQLRFALLKLFANRDDRVAFRWLLGLGASNWRAPAYRRIRERCAAESASPWQILCDVESGKYTMAHVGKLVAQYSLIRTQLEELHGCSCMAAVIDHIFPEGLETTRELRALSLRILGELEDPTPARFLAELTAAVATPEVPSEIEEVRIMSLHKSKGLNAAVTIIAGCIEGLLPMRPPAGMSDLSKASFIEEQRRLFYVGISRVKASPEEGLPGTLVLTYSQEMPVATAMGAGISPAGQKYGTAHLIASRFIGELGPSAPQPIGG